MRHFRSQDVKQLLHNKYVAVLGDSIQRSVYKDLVKLLQDDKYLSEMQLKRKGEESFLNDELIEGGSLDVMHNGVTYREVRQYCTNHHLVRFYFLTRVYSDYVESVLADFKKGPQPDVLLISSCIWDLLRYNDYDLSAYKRNLDCLFQRLPQVLSPECLVIWNMTMPTGFKPDEDLVGTLTSELSYQEYTRQCSGLNMRWDIIKGNFYSASLADFYKVDVLDMHYHFRLELNTRCKDFVHWNPVAHRKYSHILLNHIAQAWGVEPPKAPITLKNEEAQNVPPPAVALRNIPYLHPAYNSPDVGHYNFDEEAQNGPPPAVALRNNPYLHPAYNGPDVGHYYFDEEAQNGPPPAVALRNIPYPHPAYNGPDVGHYSFDEEAQNGPPPAVALRNNPYLHPAYNGPDVGHYNFGAFHPAALNVQRGPAVPDASASARAFVALLRDSWKAQLPSSSGSTLHRVRRHGSVGQTRALQPLTALDTNVALLQASSSGSRADGLLSSPGHSTTRQRPSLGDHPFAGMTFRPHMPIRPQPHPPPPPFLHGGHYPPVSRHPHRFIMRGSRRPPHYRAPPYFVPPAFLNRI
ncbi:PC-esterase domain-containing protein 1A-like isoform X3 [Hyperolius riggenbachi]|uniref:PC-esterase domain-containing protein 1A-like isoform X3 n=1 Tax=Hyperolius riggenbachi TaxID=752182 RepID=UPI0035A3618B